MMQEDGAMTHTGNTLNYNFPQTRPCLHTTLLDLVWTINQVTDDDRQVVATVAHLINSGQVRLTGTFKHTRQIIV
jgi:hypothetical protein